LNNDLPLGFLLGYPYFTTFRHDQNVPHPDQVCLSRESLKKFCSYIVISSYVVETLNTVTPQKMKEGEWPSPYYIGNSPNGGFSDLLPSSHKNFQ